MNANLFTDTINSLRYGSLNDELTEKLHELIEKCEASQKVGSLTLVLKLKPSKAGRMEILDDIKTTLPKEEKGSSIMFVTPEGNLQREDPRQLTIDGLRSVEAKTDDPLKHISEHDRKEPLRKVM